MDYVSGMTISELALKMGKPIDRDIAFDLLLDRVGRSNIDILSFMVGVAVALLVNWIPLALPAEMLPAAQVAALAGGLAWLAYAGFVVRRRNQIERELVQAQINALRLQQIATQA